MHSLDPSLSRAVEAAIAAETGNASRLRSSRRVSGGSIHETFILELEDDSRYFLKSNRTPMPRLFECEQDGLRALGEAGVIRVPEVIAVGSGDPDSSPFLVLEAIESSAPRGDFFEGFGRAFARLHRAPGADRFGYAEDNWIGATRQPNGWHEDWCTFFRERRLGFQLRLAGERGYADARFRRAGDRLLSRLESFIARPEEPPCLLHGDLWSGNYLADERGAPVLIDPAVFFGRREADLAMTRLFGGFPSAFYASYEEVWPLAEGASERIEIYQLYHLLNHLNLFGASYRPDCLAILERYGGS